MPPLLVRLNLPGFSSPEPFRLASAPPSMAGLACAVLEEIGGFTKEELQGVQNNLERVPLTLLGELCAGQLVELVSDAELEVFLATAESPRGPAIIEVRPRDVAGSQGNNGSFSEGLSEIASPAAAAQKRALSSPVQTSPPHDAASPAHASFQQHTQPASAVVDMHATLPPAPSPPLNTSSTLAYAPAPFASSPQATVGTANVFSNSPQQQHMQQMLQQQQQQLQQQQQQLQQQHQQQHAMQLRQQQQELQPQQQLPRPQSPPQYAEGVFQLSPSPAAPGATTAEFGFTQQYRGGLGTASPVPTDSGGIPSRNPERRQAGMAKARSSSAAGLFSRGPAAPVQNARQVPVRQKVADPVAGHLGGNSASQQGASGVATRRGRTMRDNGSNSMSGDTLGTATPLEPPSDREPQAFLGNGGHQAMSSVSRKPAVIYSQQRDPHQGTVYNRLYQEKDDRRRRLEEARLRHLAEQDENIRSSAQRAMGRAPSPGPDDLQSPVLSRTSTPPPMRPPLPERPLSAGSQSRRRSGGSVGPGRGGVGRTNAEGDIAQPDRKHVGHRQAVNSSMQQEVDIGPHAMAMGSPGAVGLVDASSVASESGFAAVLHNAASMSTLPGDESLYGDGVTSNMGPDLSAVGDDPQSIRQFAQTQQQRIEFLENMHQQSLRQLRKAREELRSVQQQRFKEADKVLAFEQLISEMQVHRFDGDPRMQARWEEWLQRSRSVLEAD